MDLEDVEGSAGLTRGEKQGEYRRVGCRFLLVSLLLDLGIQAAISVCCYVGIVLPSSLSLLYELGYKLRSYVETKGITSLGRLLVN